ncbi:Glycerophosphoryl diester phosphodiesterase [Rhodovulum sp. P5]|uniref:glycerophosphodiester phosphodiesterase n=1 Tax=Rhodovulum sp. P5 TaxID=1564506 RepID=UPI0009C2A068|nr:glycerophosphodiester phosphodiesterase family protein [Rhodovulum sp. P5]ARE40344.1 Glycerophosphoryl diester phosphodiesterase [Rhodovulum sp. P5]
MTTRIVCHRGACRAAPENTIASGLAAAKLGGDIVELDVRQSRDGVLYVLHDETVDRTTPFHGAIAKMDSTTLDRLDAGAWYGPDFVGEPLPRLDAFFTALSPHVDFYVEVKAARPEDVAAAIRRAGLAERCFVYSETPSLRQGLREAAPWLKRMVNWRDLDHMAEARTAEDAQIIEFHAEDMTPDRLETAAELGLEIMVHTARLDPEAFAAALNAEAHYLNIDHIDLAIEMRSELQCTA